MIRWATAAGFVLLLAASARAYRTSSDVYPELAGADRVRWPGPFIYDVTIEGGPGVSPASVLEAAGTAFGRWSEVECATVDARYGGTSSVGPTPDDGRNTLGWVATNWRERGFPADAVAATDLTFVRASDGSWQIAEADVYFNGDDYAWAPNSGDTQGSLRSATAVLTHEAGHFIGLAHPCEPGGGASVPDCSGDASFSADIMFPSYEGPDHLTLSDDDRAGACFLYGCDIAGCRDGRVCGAQGCGEPCAGAVCAPGEHCEAGACLSACTECGRCGTSADCSSGQRCVANRCVTDSVPIGDPCTIGADCGTGICAERGFCTSACSSAEACGAGLICGEGGLCDAASGLFGDACTSANECTSQLCATSASRSSCTRDCDDLRPCPGSFRCAPVDGRQVCLPSAQGGCTIAHPRATPLAILPFTAALAWLILGRRRRR